MTAGERHKLKTVHNEKRNPVKLLLASVDAVSLHFQSRIAHNVNLSARLTVLFKINSQLLCSPRFATTGISAHHYQRHNC